MGAREWVRPVSSGGAEASWRRAAFHWIDTESGQRLTLYLEGPRDLLERLEDQGFEPLADDPRIPADRVAEGRAELEP